MFLLLLCNNKDLDVHQLSVRPSTNSVLMLSLEDSPFVVQRWSITGWNDSLLLVQDLIDLSFGGAFTVNLTQSVCRRKYIRELSIIRCPPLDKKAGGNGHCVSHKQPEDIWKMHREVSPNNLKIQRRVSMRKGRGGGNWVLRYNLFCSASKLAT